MHQPLVAISTDVRQFDNYTWHAAPQQYLEAAISGAGVFPVLVPSFGDRLDFDELLSSVDGVMVTGSKSNVHPSLYGGDASEANGPYDPARDATTLPLIRKAIERGVPLLAICRGIQEMNVALGGTLGTEIQEREGSLDHRAPVSDNQDERFAIHQTISIKPGSCLAGVFGAGDIKVNSRASPGDRPAGSEAADRGGRRRRHGRGGLGARTPAPSPSACNGTPNTGSSRTATRQRYSAPSAMRCACTRRQSRARAPRLNNPDYQLPAAG